jgi:hypothetical protein
MVWVITSFPDAAAVSESTDIPPADAINEVYKAGILKSMAAMENRIKL